MKNPISKWANEAQKRENAKQQNNPLNKKLELRKALAEVDRLTLENVNKQDLNIRLGKMLDIDAKTIADLKKENSELKDEVNGLLLRNEKLREICISLELQLDDIDDIIKKITNNEK